MPITNVADEAVFKEWDDRVVRATTTAASLDAVQASGNIPKTRSTTMSNDPLSQEIGVNTPRSDEERIEHQELTDNVPPSPHDSPLSGGHTPGSDEGRTDLNELMKICTQLSNRVLALEHSKTAQDLVIKKLQKRVKRLENALRARTLGMKLFKIGTSRKKTLDKENVSKQERNDSNKTEELNLSDKESGGTEVFDDTTAAEKDVNVAELVSTVGDAVNAASVILDVSTARYSNVSAVGPSTSTARDIFEDEMTTIADILVAIRSTRPRTTSVVICNVEEEPRRATPVPIVQSQEKERKRFFAAQRAEQVRNKPPTRAQLRNKMVTYLKHMGKYTHNQLKSKSFEEIQKLYERKQKWINDFVPMDFEMKLEDDDAKKEELRACLDIVPVDDIAMDFESLATKYPIVDWKTHILIENIMYYQIIKANESSKNYKIFSGMLDDFDRQDVVDLYMLVKERLLKDRFLGSLRKLLAKFVYGYQIFEVLPISVIVSVSLLDCLLVYLDGYHHGVVPADTYKTSWNNIVPRKVNVFAWRATIGRIPVLVELD
ncbi:hypothetical protein Tco_0891386 [Tanacetum coccineum]|uniref:Uncharacterized protein n=1 Tax=Tanacetum coccineum TaxID=301880 RepID=A0ABQ5C886_9ASTR